MDVLATLTEDMKIAMRARDAMALETVRYLLAQVKNAQIDKPGHEALTELEFTAIVKKVIKNTQEAMDQYAAGGRQDLVDAEKPKLEFMQKYLPKQLSEDELKTIVAETIAENPDLGVGPLTGIIMKKTAGTADGGLVSKLIRELV
jgi:uncharacterized protein YqeY